MEERGNGSQRNLPIRVFEKRQQVDERLTEGGGNDQPPKWVLQGEELQIRSKLLQTNVSSVKENIERKLTKFSYIPAVIKAKISDQALAKSHRSDFVQFFNTLKQDKIIGFSENHELLIRIDKLAQLSEITQKLNKFEGNAKIISSIESIDTFDPIIELSPVGPEKEVSVYRIQLFDYKDTLLNKKIFEAFKQLLSNNNHFRLVKSVKYTDNVEMHRVIVDSAEALEELEDFQAIMAIEPMPRMEVVEDDFFDGSTTQIPLPISDISYPIVGVLDSGIADVLKPWVVGNRYTNYPLDRLNSDHGSFVSGIIGFGDLFEGQSYTGVNGCHFVDCAIFPDRNKETLYEDDLIDNVREAIEKYSDRIKIWNMSIGMGYEVKHFEFSKLGMALDNIQDENDVLIIKSAGNCRNFLSGNPNGRIAGGADSVRALTVGSIAHSEFPTDIARKNHLSPFSRIGPGPASIIKPDLVHYGGNAGFHNNNPSYNGVSSILSDGRKAVKVGTSFSTPRISSIAADLNHKMKEDFDPILLKCLILHSCKYPIEVTASINDKLNELGFGVPKAANEILFNDPYEITLILRDTLHKGDFIEILDFPFPQSLVDQSGHYNGQIFVTMVNHPILENGQASEYCQSNLEVKLGTYDQKKQRDITKRTIRNEIGRDGGHNLLRASIYSKKKAQGAHKTFSNTEKMLVQYGDKFYPNKKYVLDLSELTPGNKKYIKSPKSWYLKVEGLYRDFIERTAERSRMPLSQEFCVIITIRDPQRKTPVYTDVTRLLDNFNFIHRNIQVEQNIQIRGDLSSE
ncbi:hypothetical protein PAESOLCIP111_06716 [Paenibacillus solanacearum]|uniref:Peptidase S8/S53 domain-containing protein n=1 Tax=Paenibacillus solanacearum TaxID=2048548 RepID=A0A916KAR1_9BACL|nr:S8 family peptidase [Paenibacillus solanacearum]CAG7653169.1 hypothetical protein PAESOLCIP111_06716 [Paenibacillus solanacearum]